MRVPGSSVSPRHRGRDDSSRLETRYIPKENKEQAQIQRYDSGCVHGWRSLEKTVRNALFPAQWSWIPGAAGVGDARQGRRAATFALRTRRSAFCALDSTQERRVLGREKHAHMVVHCRASQTISCHRPPHRRELSSQQTVKGRSPCGKVYVGGVSSQLLYNIQRP